MWLKIKVWTKVAVFALLFIYALMFVANNSANKAKFWYWFRSEDERSVLLLVLFSFVVGVLGAILLRTTFKTLRQVRELKHRSRADRLEREMADMKTKAAMLRSRTADPTASDVTEPVE